MIEIDGSRGEGGGQILRTSLTLSMITGQPMRLDKIRGGRSRPGLQRQHLTAVQAAAAISGATVTGDAIGSRELSFSPAQVRAGDYHFAIGTAGSCLLLRLTEHTTTNIETIKYFLDNEIIHQTQADGSVLIEIGGA